MIIAYPKTKPLLSDLGLDLQTYKRTSDCNPGSFHYTEEKDGISYALDGDVVSEIIYYPNAEDKRRLSQCRPALSKLSLQATPNKSLDASGGSLFLNLHRPAMVK
jgi:hypothetical protein